MGRTARKAPDDTGEIKTKDFAQAVRLWRNDIKPAVSKVGEHNQEASSGYKSIKKLCHIQPAAAKLAFKLADTEEAKRDDFIRCLTGLLSELNIPLQSNDLVDQAESPRPKPKLVTLQMGQPSDGTETDLADAAEDDFDEASEDELAQQEGRGEPAAGTGAAAIAAMNAAADED